MADPSIEELRRERAQLREEIREAHGVLRDLRREMREARELLPLLTDELFTAEVKKHVDALSKVTDEAMKTSVAKITKSFDELAATLMGRDRTSRRKGRVPLPDLLQARATLDAARRERQQPQR